jgi:hypothetical protein
VSSELSPAPGLGCKPARSDEDAMGKMKAISGAKKIVEL